MAWINDFESETYIENDQWDAEPTKYEIIIRGVVFTKGIGGLGLVDRLVNAINGALQSDESFEETLLAAKNIAATNEGGGICGMSISTRRYIKEERGL